MVLCRQLSQLSSKWATARYQAMALWLGTPGLDNTGKSLKFYILIKLPLNNEYNNICIFPRTNGLSVVVSLMLFNTVIDKI